MSARVLHPRTLPEWLSYLDSLNPDRIELGLQRVRQVLERLNLKSDSLIIEVAGTNGKGSTAALIAGACVQAGISTGLYTSPHLYSFTERVKIDGHEVAEDQLCEAFDAVERSRGEVALTYFEYTTLAALVCFARQGVKVCVLEVGLGGRLDAVNALDADLAVITSIGLDHMALLGSTEAEIAHEKAGIMRRRHPVVLGTLGAEARAVVKKEAGELEVPVWEEGERFTYQYTVSGGVFTVQLGDGKTYQLKTAVPLVPSCCVGPALAALYLMQTRLRLQLDEEAVLKAVSTVCLPGRMQRVSLEPSIILDVAHNVPAAVHLRSELQHRALNGRRFACVGMLKDKDIEGVMQVMSDCFERFYLVTLHTERGALATRLGEALKQQGYSGSLKTYQEFNAALRDAVTALNPEDELIIFGSFVTVSLAGKYFGLNK
ncbi:MAG: bifunctional folylpolyglutamate synthase/dihydrofolate synthase [Succinivibrio sp.]|nr:bifunctional folylpolyglutamate synthase/dihydrofolate synthase [Succinivibrio sp.]